jgi:hypothetical protein
MNRASKITLADVVAAGLICLAGAALIGWPGSRTQGSTLLVRDPAGNVLKLSLREDRTVGVAGLAGETTIEIANGSARFTSSPCPHKTCVERGAVSRSGEWIACVPNGIIATVTGEADYDGITP